MSVKRGLLLAAGTLSVATLATAPSKSAPPFKVESSVEISRDEPDVRHVETVLAVNPRDANVMIAASIAFGDTDRVPLYASADGGRTWRRGRDRAGKPMRLDGIDPSVAFDGDGAAYALSLGSSMAVTKSTDGGLTWSAPVPVPGEAWDRPWIGAGVDRILYVSGKMPVTVFGELASDMIGVSSSVDGGSSFGFPRLFLPSPTRALVNLVGNPLVLRDGRLLLGLQLFSPESLERSPLLGRYGTIVSSDRGRHFGPPRPGPEFRTYGHAQEGKSLLGLCAPQLAQDESRGPRAGRLYLAWPDAGEGFYRIFVSFSADSGEHWIGPAAVGPNESETDASVPAIAVDGKGVVGVAWYDRRADPTNACYQLFFAASRDGGSSFDPAAAVDPAQSCPLSPHGRDPAATRDDPVSSEYRFKNGGDTLGIVGLPTGGFQIAWARPGRSELQLWSTRVIPR